MPFRLNKSPDFTSIQSRQNSLPGTNINIVKIINMVETSETIEQQKHRIMVAIDGMNAYTQAT